MLPGLAKFYSAQLLALSICYCVTSGVSQLAIAQEALPTVVSKHTTADRAYIEQQIKNLDDSSYRTRQLARWRLEQSPRSRWSPRFPACSSTSATGS